MINGKTLHPSLRENINENYQMKVVMGSIRDFLGNLEKLNDRSEKAQNN